jgi:hypothetical protein
MFKPFEERRAERMRTRPGSSRILTLAELLAEPCEPTSEDRLDELSGSVWSPEQFSLAASSFASSTGLTIVTGPPARELPPLSSDVHFKYSGEYEDARKVLIRSRRLRVVSVLEADRVIGYGIAHQRKAGSSIGIIDVDYSSQRSAGLGAEVACGDTRFSVGVGHVVVATLLPMLKPPVSVDATNPPSRYIFKSLGFVTRSGQANPCLLDLGDVR